MPASAVYIMTRGVSNQHQHVFWNTQHYLQLKSNRNEKHFTKENMATDALWYANLKFLDNSSLNGVWPFSGLGHKAPDSNWIVTRGNFWQACHLSIFPSDPVVLWEIRGERRIKVIVHWWIHSFFKKEIPVVGVDWETQALSTTAPCPAPIQNHSSSVPTLEFSSSLLVQINHSVRAEARGKDRGISVRAEIELFLTSLSQARCFLFLSSGIADVWLVVLMVLGCV